MSDGPHYPLPDDDIPGPDDPTPTNVGDEFQDNGDEDEPPSEDNDDGEDDE